MFQVTNNKVMLSDLSYRIGKKLVQVVVPAFSTLYFSLSGIWGLPATTQVVGTLAAVATFGGVCLGLSSKTYDQSGAALEKLDKSLNHDGDLVIETKEDGHKLMTLDLDNAPEGYEKKGTIIFKVVHK